MKRGAFPTAGGASTRGLDLFDHAAQAPAHADACVGRHRGAVDSVLAETRTGASVRAQQKADVLAAIQAAGPDGLTVDELAVQWETTPNRISGRFTELRFDGAILPAGRRKTRTGNTATAWKARRFALGEPAASPALSGSGERAGDAPQALPTRFALGESKTD